MAKEDNQVELYGVVETMTGGGQYIVSINEGDNVTQVRARLGGKMKFNRINVMPGDYVKVAFSPYDMTHGMIIFREKK